MDARMPVITTETVWKGGKAECQRVRFAIEVEIEYPLDMPVGTAITHASSPAEWIRKYALAQAKREEEQWK